MFQTFHIFRKDAFHLWPEILVALALFAGFAWSAPSNWVGSPYAVYTGILSVLLHGLLPISWLVLISRSIHDEPLVGDRQFWTSRPYHWANLLVAKLLFLVVFIYIPFLIMQGYLLKHAGLYPTTVIPALLHNLLLLTGYFILPIAALAAVTTTFVRLLLSFLGALVYVIVVLALFVWWSFGRMPAPHLGYVTGGIFLFMLAGTLVYQYARRHTLYARLALLATPLLVILVSVLMPTALLIRHGYPALPASNTLKLSPLPDMLHPGSNPADKLQLVRGNVLLTLPMQVSGVDENTAYRVEGATITVDAPGVHWTAPWRLSSQQIGNNSPITFVQTAMPLEIFNKVRTIPADVTTTLALDHLKAGLPYIVTATRTAFPVPSHGVCSFDPVSEEDPNDVRPVCRFAFELPENTYLSAPVSPASCSQPAAAEGRGSFDQPGLPLSFDPVQTENINLSTGDPNPGHTYVLCPDSKLSIVQATSQGKASISFQQKGVKLDGDAARISPKKLPAPRPLDQEPPVQQ